MTPSTIPREELAKCLIREGYNASELAEALEVTRQSALAIMNRIDRSRLRSELSAASRAAKSTGRVLLTLGGNTRVGDCYE